jgi:hypothetical protein
MRRLEQTLAALLQHCNKLSERFLTGFCRRHRKDGCEVIARFGCHLNSDRMMERIDARTQGVPLTATPVEIKSLSRDLMHVIRRFFIRQDVFKPFVPSKRKSAESGSYTLRGNKLIKLTALVGSHTVARQRVRVSLGRRSLRPWTHS